jgi:hypothetical protein
VEGLRTTYGREEDREDAEEEIGSVAHVCRVLIMYPFFLRG